MCVDGAFQSPASQGQGGCVEAACGQSKGLACPASDPGVPVLSGAAFPQV